MKINKTVSKATLIKMLKEANVQTLIPRYSYEVNGQIIIDKNKEYLKLTWGKTNDLDKIIVFDEDCKEIVLPISFYRVIFSELSYEDLYCTERLRFVEVIFEDKDYSIKIPEELRNAIYTEYPIYLSKFKIHEKKLHHLYHEIDRLEEEIGALKDKINTLKNEFNETNSKIYNQYIVPHEEKNIVLFDFDDIPSPF